MGGLQSRVVYVVWVDSARSDGWCRYGEGSWGVITCHSVGLLVEDGEDFIAVACSVGVDDEGVVTQACDPICIPRVAIKSMWDVAGVL